MQHEQDETWPPPSCGRDPQIKFHLRGRRTPVTGYTGRTPEPSKEDFLKEETVAEI
jgi:hypothetical protein